MCYIWFGAYPNHMHIQIIVKNNLLGKKEGGKEEKTRKEKHNGTVMCGFKAGLLARSQFASGR
jgi:hypothetical protein